MADQAFWSGKCSTWSDLECAVPNPLSRPPVPRRLPPRLLVRAALGLRELLRAAADAVVPPQLALHDHLVGLGKTHALRAFVRLGVADLLAEGGRTSAELATATGVDPDALHRLLRGLAVYRLVRLDAEGRFHETRLGRVLRRDVHASLAPFAEYLGSGSNAAAWGDFETTVRTGKNAFERLHGMSVWDWFERHPDERATFAASMASLTELEGPAIVNLYPFAEVQRVCDVGGGRGTLLALLLERHAHLRGVLMDSPGVLDAARVFLAERGVLARVELVPGSFFEGVPAGADAYLLKNVLHDWDDARSAAILGRCRESMASGARLLLVEEIVETDTVSGTGPLSDLQMMTVCSEGRERGRSDYARLLGGAGFTLRRVFGLGAGASVLEGIAS